MIPKVGARIHILVGQPMEIPARMDALEAEALRLELQRRLIAMHVDLDARIGFTDSQPPSNRRACPGQHPDGIRLKRGRGKQSESAKAFRSPSTFMRTTFLRRRLSGKRQLLWRVELLIFAICRPVYYLLWLASDESFRKPKNAWDLAGRGQLCHVFAALRDDEMAGARVFRCGSSYSRAAS